MKKKNKKHNLQDTRITYKINHLFYYVLQPYYREGNTFVRKSCITKNKCITKQFIPGKFHYCVQYTIIPSVNYFYKINLITTISSPGLNKFVHFTPPPLFDTAFSSKSHHNQKTSKKTHSKMMVNVNILNIQSNKDHLNYQYKEHSP